MRLSGIKDLPRDPYSLPMFRAVRFRHLAALFNPVASKHSAVGATRFNPGEPAQLAAGEHPFEILYLAPNHVVALYEVRALRGAGSAGQIVPDTHDTWVVCPLEVRLNRVVDLTDVRRQRALGIEETDLVAPWGTPPPLTRTQEIGAALYRAGDIEGFLTPSAALGSHTNLVIFPERLQPPSWLGWTDPTDERPFRLVPNAPTP